MEITHKRFEALHARLSEINYSALVEQQPGLYQLGIGRTLAVQALNETVAAPTGMYLRATAAGEHAFPTIQVAFLRDNRPAHKARELYVPTEAGVAISTGQPEASRISVTNVARGLGVTLCRNEVAQTGFRRSDIPELRAGEEELDFLDDFIDHPDNHLAASVTHRRPGTFDETDFVMITQPTALR